MARNEKKMKEKIEEIKAECPNKNIKYDYIVADLGNMNSCEQYRTLLEEKTKDMDVAVVIANAGSSSVGDYKDLPD